MVVITTVNVLTKQPDVTDVLRGKTIVHVSVDLSWNKQHILSISSIWKLMDKLYR